MVIVVNGVRKSHGSVEAVCGIDITVREGECYALLGGFGAGKSTAISCLATLSEPDAGTAEIAGYRLGADNDAIRALIGVLLEHVCLDPRLTVRENVALHASFHGLSARHWTDEVEELAVALELFELLDTRVERLSAGEKRRADLIRAMAHQPSILLVDEPIADIDPVSANLIWQVLMDQRAQGITIVFTTEQAFLAEQADTVGILVDGRVVAQDSPTNLINFVFPSKLTLRLSDPEACRLELESYGVEMPVADHSGAIVWELDAEQARDVIALLGDQVVDFTFQVGTLEEAFQALVSQGFEADWEEPRPDFERWEDEADMVDEVDEADEATQAGVIAPVWPDEGFGQYQEGLRQIEEELKLMVENLDQTLNPDNGPDRNQTASGVENEISWEQATASPDWTPPVGYDGLDQTAFDDRDAWSPADEDPGDTSSWPIGIEEVEMSEETWQEVSDDWVDDPEWDDDDETDQGEAVIDEEQAPEPDQPQSRAPTHGWRKVASFADTGRVSAAAWHDVTTEQDVAEPSQDLDDTEEVGVPDEPEESLEQDYDLDELADPTLSPKDQLESMSRQVTDALLGATLPTFDEQFPGELFPPQTSGASVREEYAASVDDAALVDDADYSVRRRTPSPIADWKPAPTSKPIDEVLLRQARAKQSVERRIEEARRRRASERGV